jgi:hypothetical protein
MVAKAIGGILGVAIIAVVALLFLGGSIETRSTPVGEALFPPGSIYMALPMDADIACPEEDPEDCDAPTPIPTIDPAVVSDAQPLLIPSVTIPIDRVGTYVVPLGTAVLANGVLTHADARLATEMRPDLETRNDAIALRIIGEDGGYRGNKWLDGWHAGTETVQVTLEFEVLRFDAPTTLEVDDIIVR